VLEWPKYIKNIFFFEFLDVFGFLENIFKEGGIVLWQSILVITLFCIKTSFSFLFFSLNNLFFFLLTWLLFVFSLVDHLFLFTPFSLSLFFLISIDLRILVLGSKIQERWIYYFLQKKSTCYWTHLKLSWSTQ